MLAFQLLLDLLLVISNLDGMKGEKTDDRGEITGKSAGFAGTPAMGADGGVREG
jgi:hypothetical protein